MTCLYRGPLLRASSLLLNLAAALCGCASPGVQLEELARQQNHRVVTLQTTRFELRAVLPNAGQPDNRLRVYLEGDGRAWITATRPSLDPTPRDLLVARLALADPRPSVYLARPCQFVQSPDCGPHHWTAGRLSQTVLDSLSEALDRLKQQHGNTDFELIGYSGGGALALLLAADRNDIAQVQTLAGNLSPRRWAQLLELTPLQDSLEPLDRVERLKALPQRHLAGLEDRVMPASLLAVYTTQLGPADCLELHRLAGVSHQAGWLEHWPQWRDHPIACDTAPVPATERDGIASPPVATP